jgi:hypothetical protein
VRQLRCSGLGGLWQYTTSGEGGAPKRAGMRLAQWALLLLMQRRLLPGLAARPRASDPEFASADLEALALLGVDADATGELPRCARPRGASREEPTLVYAPCCPRDVYSGLVAANLGAGRLSRLALVSTSLASQGASSALVLALARPPPGAGAGPAGPPGGGGELHAQLHARGGCVEAMLPDVGGAHGIATSVHLFPLPRLGATGMLQP